MTASLRRLAALAILVVVTASARLASADARAETRARQALKLADADYLKTDFAKALGRLQGAERGCGEASCAVAIHAALLRDLGMMQLRLGQPGAAASSFRRSRKIDPSIALNPDYAAKDLREAWEAAGGAPAASGNFVHQPASGQSTSTPLPIYVELESSEVTTVVVKYKNAAMRSFRRAVLERMAGGWGGYIPCADVVAGTIRYYVQGFDASGELASSSGDPSRTFEVSIRDGITREPPSLPGEPPPSKCTEEALQALNLGGGERCTEDRQCKSGTCASGRCRALQGEPEPSSGTSRPLARLWIGVAGSLDLTMPASSNELCATVNGVSTRGYWCTTPEGADLDSRVLVAGRRGTSSGDLTPGGVHITATVDYAVNANLLLGIRIGYVANAYPGEAAASAGKTISAAIHVEGRAAWVFGDEPIARSGLAPYLFAAGGVARFDAPVTVMVAQQGVAGYRAVRAWQVAGPAFGALGGGARYAFSPRLALWTGAGLYAALGPGAFGVNVSPELSLQYGF